MMIRRIARSSLRELALGAALICAAGGGIDVAFAAAGSAQDVVTTRTEPSVVPSPLLAIDQNRSAVVDRIVRDWGDALSASDAGLSSEQLRDVLTGLRADHLLASSLAGNLDGLRNALSNAIASTADVKPNLLKPKALGDPGDDLVYTPIAPCRIVDTRNVGGAFAGGGETRNYHAFLTAGTFAAQGGAASNCGIPANPPAAALNITTVGGGGFLTAWQFGSAQPLASTLNPTPGVVVANGALVPLCQPGCGNEFSIFTFGAHVVIDIVGYFRAPQGGYVASVAAGTGIAVGGTASNPVVGIANGGVDTTQLASNAVTQSKLSPLSGPTPGQVLGSDGTNLQWQTVSGGGGGGVSSVTASAPLASSGGSTPNISLTGIVPVVNGGTGQLSLNMNGVLVGNLGAPVSSIAPSTEAQVMVSAFPNVPTWTSSPTLGGNLSVVGQSVFQGNVGLGTGTPQARFHVLQTSNPLPPRVESWGNTGFAAGWDFYWNNSGKGYVGLPDPSAGVGPGEMILFGGSNTSTSLWAGQTRALTVAGNGSGNIGIGTGPVGTSRLYVDAGNNSTGVNGYSSSGTAVQGFTNGGWGVYGDAGSGRGVVGKSTSSWGVYGETYTASLSAAGVYGYSGTSGAIGVTGEANIGTATGVYGVSSSATGFGMYARNSGGGRALLVEGNAGQTRTSGGLAKAMAYVDQNGNMVRCYNGLTNSSTVPCGFSVSHFDNGHYMVNFGFAICDRFMSILARSPANPFTLVAGSFRTNADCNQVEVFTGITDAVQTGDDADFHIIIF